MKNPALLEEIKTYRGRDEVPEDFDAFWDGEVKKVSNLPAYQLEERNFHIPQVKCYELTFEGSKEGKVYARVVLPKSEEKVPLIFHFHGYMGRGWDWADMLAYTVAGYGVVSMDVRGQSGYSQDGLRSPLGIRLRDILSVVLWKVGSISFIRMFIWIFTSWSKLLPVCLRLMGSVFLAMVPRKEGL